MDNDYEIEQVWKMARFLVDTYPGFFTPGVGQDDVAYALQGALDWTHNEVVQYELREEY